MNKCKLGKLLKVKHGFAFKSENYVEKSEYALVTLANISSTNDFQYNEEKTTYYGASFPSEFILKTGDLIMPLTEQVMGLFGNSAFVPYIKDTTFVLNQRVGKVLVDEEKADKFYIHYLLSTDSVRNQLEYRASGTRQRNISPEDVYDVEVFVPDLEEQRRIGKLLYALEQRVYNNNCINDNLQQQMFIIYESMMANAAKGQITGHYIKAESITEIITGKEDANFSSIDGEYKFFTCSNVPLRCNQPAFDSASILIAGNGDFNVKHYTGKFNAYQRTYVLSPPREYYALLYLASLYRINSFKSASAGSIVKFITKGDVENIPLFIPDDKQYLDQLNSLVYMQEHIYAENEKLVQMRDWLLPMLMNGQATIGD